MPCWNGLELYSRTRHALAALYNRQRDLHHAGFSTMSERARDMTRNGEGDRRADGARLQRSLASSLRAHPIRRIEPTHSPRACLQNLRPVARIPIAAAAFHAFGRACEVFVLAQGFSMPGVSFCWSSMVWVQSLQRGCLQWPKCRRGYLSSCVSSRSHQLAVDAGPQPARIQTPDC